jgi:hypothetical protein
MNGRNLMWKAFLAVIFQSLLISSFRPFTFYPSIQVSRTASKVMMASTINTPISNRIQKIKEITLQKEILNDISASEFALRVEVKKQERNTLLIDYDKLIAKLEKHLQLLQKPDSKFDFATKLIPRLIQMKEDLTLAANNLPTKHITINYEPIVEEIEENNENETISLSNNSNNNNNNDNLSSSTSTSTTPIIPTTIISQTAAKNVEQLKKELSDNLRILVREDGTVDWDGAIQSGKQVAKIGSELWERLNGKAEEEGMPSLTELFSPAQAKFPITDDIDSLTHLYQSQRELYSQTINQRDQLRMKLRQTRREGKVPLDAIDIQQMRTMELQLKEQEKTMKIIALHLDLEKICSYLQQELESSVDISEQRFFITEVSLLDKQLASLFNAWYVDEETTSSSSSPSSNSNSDRVHSHDSHSEISTTSHSHSSHIDTSAETTTTTNNNNNNRLSTSIIRNGWMLFISSRKTIEEEERVSGLLALIDDDELSYIANQVSDIQSINQSIHQYYILSYYNIYIYVYVFN